MAEFHVRHAGPLVTLQDGGRHGMMRFGVTESGAMDRVAFEMANRALGNPAGATAIEVSLGGLELECRDGAVSFAVVGGNFDVRVDGRPLGPAVVAAIGPGSRLSIRPGAAGSWAYLAFAGELQALRWLGSTATLASSKLGGGAVVAGQSIVVGGAAVHEELHRSLTLPEWHVAEAPVRVVLGPQDRHFSPAAIDTFLSAEFALTDAYDRMGVRLRGPALVLGDSLSIPSEGIARGSIQVAGDGVATVLLADHQTTGGYPKIATVVSSDLDRLAQLRSGGQVSFKAIAPAEAIAIARATRTMIDEVMRRSLEGAGSIAERLNAQNLIDGVVDGRH